jgi:PAS domain S-box-containing protein
MPKIRKNTKSTSPRTSKKIPDSTHDKLHHLAFDKTAQANIIATVSNGKIITANTAACKLLGYSKKELLTKNTAAILDEKERSVKKMMKQRSAEGQSTALVKAMKKNGESFPAQITSAVFIEDGIEKSITTISDISQGILDQKNIDTKKEKIVADNIIQAQKTSDAKIEENNEWIKYIAKTSYDVMWDWDISSGEIYVGDSIEEVFGYKVKNNTVNFTDFSMCLLPGEKDTVEIKLQKALASADKSWSDSYSFKRHDGSVASITIRASIVRDSSGKAIRLIGAIHDISRLQELENKLEEQISIQVKDNEKFLLPAKHSFDVIWDWNLVSNEVFAGEGFEELFGDAIQNNKNNIGGWGNYIHGEDKEAVEKGLHRTISSHESRWEHAYRFTRADGSVGKVFNRANIFRHADGKAYRMIGAIQDISRQKNITGIRTDLTDSKKKQLAEKIKDIIVEVIHYSDEQLKTNFSDHLSKKLDYDYTYLANLFSEVEDIPIQQFIIIQKIERVKELIVNDEFSLTQLAWKLHYSSVAHLSNQFKKVTGLTPSRYKEKMQARNAALQNV